MFSRSAIGIRTRTGLAFNTACLGALTLLAGCASPDADVMEAGAAGVRTIGESASFRGINGILFGPDGDLYLTSVVTPALARIDPESGEILDNWGLEDGAKSPDDLAFGSDGSVYWTDISNGEVAMRTPTGETRVVASPGVGVNPITFSDDGRLFVSQCFMDTNLFELDPAGEAEPRLIRDDLGPGLWPERHGLGFRRRQALRPRAGSAARSCAWMSTAARWRRSPAASKCRRRSSSTAKACSTCSTRSGARSSG